MEFAYKHIFARDMLAHLKDIARMMRNIVREGGDQYVELVLEYVLEQSDSLPHKDFIALINDDISPTIGRQVMTLAERIRAEGRQEGRAEGRQEGRVEGRQEGRQEGIKHIALKLIKNGDPLERIAKLTELSLEELNALRDDFLH